MGLIDCLHKVFNKDYTRITRTNYVNYPRCLSDVSADSTVFVRNFILCESVVYNLLKGDICTTKFKIIDISKSVDDFYRDLLHDDPPKPVNSMSRLSPKEYNLCKLFKMNYTDNRIAEDLNISKTTLSCHRRNILSKLKLKSKQQLYLFCKTL